MLPIFQLVDVTVYTSLVCYQGSRLEQVAPLGSKDKVVRQKAWSRDVSSSGSLHEQRAPPYRPAITLLLISHPGRAIHQTPKESSPSSQNLLLPPAQPTELKHVWCTWPPRC